MSNKSNATNMNPMDKKEKQRLRCAKRMINKYRDMSDDNKGQHNGTRRDACRKKKVIEEYAEENSLSPKEVIKKKQS